MKYYKKIINDRPVIKTLKDIVIKKNGLCTYNPTEEMVISDGWEIYETPEYIPSEEEILDQAKKDKIQEIEEYDGSSEVNNCIIVKDGVSLNYWANKLERDSLKGAVQDCIRAGREMYRLDLRELGIYLSIPCETLIGMLCALEVYAIDCYNKTTDHIYAVKSLETVGEVTDYDYRTGYPSVLVFEM